MAVDLLTLELGTRVDRLAELTGLHMFVITLRCDHTCTYCQVLRQTKDRTNSDMDPRRTGLI